MNFYNINIKALEKRNIIIQEDFPENENITEITLVNAKNGSPVLIINGKYTSSKYDPEREAENLTKEINEGSFVVYSGISNFYPILSLIRKKCKIIMHIPVKKIFLYIIKNMDFTNILNYERIYFTFSENEITETIKRFYFPGREGNFNFIESRSEKDLFPEKFNYIVKVINNTLEEIKSDYSVQAHFGKIWTRNIIQNLKLISCLENNIEIKQNKKFGCIITAAGPSLNRQLDKLSDLQNDYLILATDTTLPVLIKHKIAPDFFFSIDPQIHSLKHILDELPEKTALIADLCCNTSLIRNVLKQGNPVFFSMGNHPLSVLSENLGVSNLLKLENGTGSVTITAISFAAFLGWSEIILLGGDFANTNFAPYCRGTYLSGIFDAESNRLKNSETDYAGILFRSDVILHKESRIYESKLLNRYGNFCKTYCKNRNIRVIREIKPAETGPQNTIFLKSPEIPSSFFVDLMEKISEKQGGNNEILPLAAWLKYKRNPEKLQNEAMSMTEKYIKYFI